jgi:hypothetical protein
MPYYAVMSGDLFRCVLADDPRTACVHAIQQHLADEYYKEAEGVHLGRIFHTAECGQSASDQVYVDTLLVCQTGGYESHGEGV